MPSQGGRLPQPRPRLSNHPPGRPPPQVPPMPAEQARAVIERELGAPLAAIFEWIELEEPLGSASISQVGCMH